MTVSKAFLYFCLSFIGGIFLNSFSSMPQFLILAFLITGILLIFIFLPIGGIKNSLDNKNLVVVGFCLLFLVLGIWRHLTSESKVIYPKEEKDIIFVGIITAEPDIRDNNTKLIIKPVENEGQKIAGKVLVTVNSYPEYQYGDKLKIKGNLKIPLEFEDFNYKNYLAKDGIYSVIYWPDIELISKNEGNFVLAKIFQFKNTLRESLYQSLSPPQSSLLVAMIFGDQRRMSEDLRNKLNVTGLRHITAVSGMNVTILTGILMTFLISLGLWRQQAFYFTLVLILVYMIMTGLQASIVRAGIMGFLFLWAQYLGRQNLSTRAVVFAGALMLIFNPQLLTLDVGFQLSFLAVMGIIHFHPFIRNFFITPPSQSWGKLKYWFYAAPHYFFSFLLLKNRILQEILAMTLSAQIFTLPILIYNFGYISQISPLTNILVVPLLPLLMILGLISAISGIIWKFLGFILSFPSWFLLTYLLKIVDFFSQPWALRTIENVHWLWLIIYYIVLASLLIWLKNRQKLKFLNY
ncbi:MAG: ComEC/Rec2 family competence protein [Patescibacteria group bacterium]